MWLNSHSEHAGSIQEKLVTQKYIANCHSLIYIFINVKIIIKMVEFFKYLLHSKL